MAEVIYLRCSTRPQALGDSLSRQFDECRAYARARGLTVGWVFAMWAAELDAFRSETLRC